MEKEGNKALLNKIKTTRQGRKFNSKVLEDSL